MAKKVIPFGERFLVKRKRIGEKLGSGIIVASEQTAERPTDLAVVTYVPEQTLVDDALLKNAEKIIKSLSKGAIEGDSNSFNSLLEYNKYLHLKSIQPGDNVMISKYVGTDFHDTASMEMQTLVDGKDIIGVVIDG